MVKRFDERVAVDGVGFGYVPQDIALYADLSGRENLLILVLGSLLFGVD